MVNWLILNTLERARRVREGVSRSHGSEVSSYHSRATCERHLSAWKLQGCLTAGPCHTPYCPILGVYSYRMQQNDALDEKKTGLRIHGQMYNHMDTKRRVKAERPTVATECKKGRTKKRQGGHPNMSVQSSPHDGGLLQATHY
jgi:hypothetical protein